MKKITLLLMVCMFTKAFYASSKETKTVVDVSIEAEDGTLNRGANIQDCVSCSGGKHVGDLGGPPESAPNKYFASVVSVVSAGTYTMNLYASSGDPRSIFISVNGSTGTEVSVNSGDWTTPAMYELVVTLAEGTNTIKFYNDNSFAPNIDKFDLTLLNASVCTDCYGPFEAENGVITAPAIVSSCNTCSGGQHVSDMGFLIDILPMMLQ
ncbi:MAG: hypothetical protein HC798_03800 [Polaribacter sp.]|nr:hypothetical protein [Polaribacter sp.]